MGIYSYYLAISLDGYLAREDGGVDWLDPFQAPLDTPYDYPAYYDTVKALLMGRMTYEKGLEFGPYPYEGKPAWLLTSNPGYAAHSDVRVVSENQIERLREFQSEVEGRVWVVDGAQVAGMMLREGFLDEIILTIVPVSLGSGISWHNS